VQHAAPGTDELHIARPEPIAKSHAVAMFDAAVEQVADHLDSGVRMRTVTDAALPVMAVMVDEDEWPEGDALFLRQRVPQVHVAIVDKVSRRNNRCDVAVQVGTPSEVHSTLVSVRCIGKRGE
jgi:hypothetical protein